MESLQKCDPPGDHACLVKSETWIGLHVMSSEILVLWTMLEITEIIPQTEDFVQSKTISSLIGPRLSICYGRETKIEQGEGLGPGTICLFLFLDQ